MVVVSRKGFNNRGQEGTFEVSRNVLYLDLKSHLHPNSLTKNSFEVCTCHYRYIFT